MAYEVVDSKTVYEGRVFDVHQDQVRLPDGRTVRIDVVAHRGAVTIIPLDEEGQIWFIRQYRHPAGRTLLELPAGVAEEDEAPEVSAHREIREEIGMAAGHLEALGEFFLAPGYSTEYMYVFLATGLTEDPLEGDEDEDIEVEKVPAAQAMLLAEKGHIQDAKTLAALLLARSRLFSTQ